MQLSELTDHMLKGARQAKESWVREVKGAEGMTDLPWTVHFRRGAEPIAMVYFNGNRDTMFGIARMGTIGFEADVLGVMNESYHSTSDTNPLTGDPWAPGEMQVLAEQHDGLANGWVREALTLLACNRAGDVKTMWLPYAIKGRAVEWGEVFGLDLEVGGYVPDTLRDTMMHAPPRPPWLNDAYAEHGYEDARAQQDAATVRALSVLPDIFEDAELDNLTVALYAKPGTPRHQALRRHFDPGMFIDPN